MQLLWEFKFRANFVMKHIEIVRLLSLSGNQKVLCHVVIIGCFINQLRAATGHHSLHNITIKKVIGSANTI